METLLGQNLTFCYAGSEKTALSNVNFCIEKGEFTVVTGESGCGKTTLLKLLKKQLKPQGKMSGIIQYNGKNIEELGQRQSVEEIGFVMQNPNEQTVCDKVWKELAFGLENLGYENSEIRRKVVEISQFFNISDWYRKDTDCLSGGQKQLLNLASVMVMNPKVLLLDEPTSQLDPIASAEFLAILQKINVELGVTVVLTEHRLDEVLPLADKLLVLENGQVIANARPREAIICLKNGEKNKILQNMPSASQVFCRTTADGDCPITVKEGKKFLENKYYNNVMELPRKEQKIGEPVIELSHTFFRYSKEEKDILDDLSLTVYSGEILSVIGSNGGGKTTLLKVMGGIRRAYKGKIKVFGKDINEYKNNRLYHNNLALLPQNPLLLFIKSTVNEELDVMFYGEASDCVKKNNIIELLKLKPLLERNPLDLSGGEQQRVALAKVLLTEPKVLLLDEPTKGLDANAKKELGELLEQIKRNTTIILVTHNLEFCAEFSTRTAVLFDGKIIGCDTPDVIFGRNNFYTTQISRMSRNFYKCVTVEECVKLCLLNGRKDE